MRKSRFLGVVAVLLSSSANAQTNAQSVKDACMGDYQRYCIGVLPGGGRIVACLREHADALNASCTAAISLAARCVDDYKRFCPQTELESGELRACLLEHRADLSAGCAAVMAKPARN
jgi:hypothetical protein